MLFASKIPWFAKLIPGWSIRATGPFPSLHVSGPPRRRHGDWMLEASRSSQVGHFSSWKTWKVEKFPKKKWHAIPMEANMYIYIYTSIFQGVLFWSKGWCMVTLYHPFRTLWKIQVYIIYLYIYMCVCVSVFLFGAIYIFASYLWISLIYGNFYLNMLIERWIFMVHVGWFNTMHGCFGTKYGIFPFVFHLHFFWVHEEGLLEESDFLQVGSHRVFFIELSFVIFWKL